MGEIFCVPSGDFASELDAFWDCRGWDKIHGEVSDDRHVFRAVAFSQSGLVFGEDDVEHPM